LCLWRNHSVLCRDEVPVGFDFHAGSLTAPFNASRPHGTWESAMNAAVSWLTSAANESRNFARRAPRLANDDSVLPCTNGVTDVISDDVIADVLASRRTPTEQSDQLVDLALANSTEDNAADCLHDSSTSSFERPGPKSLSAASSCPGV
jgi:hypothetical protein